jgi:hypothetical protein
MSLGPGHDTFSPEHGAQSEPVVEKGVAKQIRKGDMQQKKHSIIKEKHSTLEQKQQIVEAVIEEDISVRQHEMQRDADEQSTASITKSMASITIKQPGSEQKQVVEADLEQGSVKRKQRVAFTKEQDITDESTNVHQDNVPKEHLAKYAVEQTEQQSTQAVSVEVELELVPIKGHSPVLV